MTSIVVVSAGLGVPSSTRLLADRLAAATAASVDDLEVVTVELREVAHELTDHLLTGFPGQALAAAIDAVRRADGLIVVTPVFSASYSGPGLVLITGGSNARSRWALSGTCATARTEASEAKRAKSLMVKRVTIKRANLDEM